MEMRHIHAFLAVADELHFTRAAQRLRVAQPAVSAAIRELEEELGARLFDRTRRRVSLTLAGAHFRIGLQETLGGLERAVRSAQRAAAGEVGRVVLHFTTLSMLSPIPAAIVGFHRERPEVELVIEQRGTSEQLEALRGGRSDLAFTVMPGDIMGIASEMVTSEPLVAILPEAHPEGGRDALDFKSIVQEPMIILPERTEPAMHAAYASLCHQVGATPRIELELDQIDAVLAFVAAGLGISLAPASVSRLRMPGVVFIPLDPPIFSGVTVLWNPETLGPAGAALLSEVRQLSGDLSSEE